MDNFGNNQYDQQGQQDNNCTYSYSYRREPEQQEIPVSPVSYYQPVEQKPRQSVGEYCRTHKWPMRAAAVVLTAALSFGCGYAGAKYATRDISNVIIERVETSAPTADGEEPVVTVTSGYTGEQIGEMVKPSVVAIVTEEMVSNSFWYGSRVSSGAGSGVIISADGYIVTNYHVVGSADTITVELHDGTTYPAQLVGAYADNDIAVIKINADGLTAAKIGNSDNVRPGQTVYAVGNPEGTFSGSMTSGIISAVDREIQVAMEVDDGQPQSSDPYSDIFGMFGFSMPGLTSNQRTVTLDVLQFDAAVSPGNSGGGLFSSSGELVGIVCAKSSNSNAEGLGFAINSNDAYEIATSIISNGSYSPAGSAENTNSAALGIEVIELTEQDAAQYGYSNAGVYVYSVTADSTLQAGLYAGDRIISVEGTMINKLSDILDLLASKQPGDVVSVTVDRSGAMMSFDITLIKAQ